MGKNIVIYNDTVEYAKRESAAIPSSQEEYLTILKSFEGLKINSANISDFKDPKTNTLIWKNFNLNVIIQRRIEAKQFTKDYHEEEINIDTRYRIHMGSKWKLYEEGVLIYDNDKSSDYDDPTSYVEKFKDATLLKAEINSDWTKAIFTFDNNLTIENTTYSYGASKRKHFFSIIKDPEPMIKILDFGNPEIINYQNDSMKLINTSLNE